LEAIITRKTYRALWHFYFFYFLPLLGTLGTIETDYHRVFSDPVNPTICNSVIQIGLPPHHLQFCYPGRFTTPPSATLLTLQYIYSSLTIFSQNIQARPLVDSIKRMYKDFHSGNILLDSAFTYISDLGMCQPVNSKMVEGGIYGVLPYMAPEVLRGHQYTKESDLYSFGIIMNEFMSEEIPYNNIPHDEYLAIKICKGLD
jgi:serine/threonine protein kinase